MYDDKQFPAVRPPFPVFLLILLFSALSGCAIDGPRARLGTLPTSTLGTPFLGPDDLGAHGYRFGWLEGNGIVYTCRAGHIDIYHVRGAADNTKYLIQRIEKLLLQGQAGFSYNLMLETSTHKIQFVYPENWNSIAGAEKERMVREVAFAAGPYLAFQAATWHEILTWFGVRFAGIEPEYNSAFTWEDLFSNLLGVRLAVQALQDVQNVYDQALTRALRKEMEQLGIQPANVARKAAEKMRNLWFSGFIFVDTFRKNFDIGLDGSITPTLVPDVPGCGEEAVSYPPPSLDRMEKYGFSILYEIRPNVFEQRAIFAAAGADRIFPKEHFPRIMEVIRQQAKEKGYLFDE
ncbi:MAG: DUF4056 domain-containing protein [Sedimentisphaerales bacterium]|nr:DUF4056 domain-containing protein [Sedimentisphaerales bacterium]